MIKISIIFLLFLSNVGFAQDTIFLNEIKILPSSHKPTKKMSAGEGLDKWIHVNTVSDYFKDFYFYKINFPLGQPLEITLFFTTGGKTVKLPKESYVEQASFEVDIFQVTNDGSVGEKITEKPFVAEFDKQKTDYGNTKKSFQLANLNLFGSSLYVRIHSTSQNKCENCYHVFVAGYRSDTPYAKFIHKIDAGINNDAVKNMIPSSGLRYKLKVLSNEY